MKNTWLKLVGLAVAFVAPSMSVQALPIINGSIAFNGTAVFNSTPISGATAFTALNNAYVAPGQQYGSYATVPNFKSVAFSPFTFSPPDASVVPLWTFTIASVVYSFDATSMTASFDSVHNTWNIGGDGVAHITGYADSTGTWNLAAGSSGASFFFGSSSAIPDGGLTVAMLGLALAGGSLIVRKLKVA